MSRRTPRGQPNHAQAATSAEMFPVTTQHQGPVQHPSDSTTAMPGSPARAAKNYDLNVTNGPSTSSSRNDTRNPFKGPHT
jgi:hypothetical protein